MADRDDERRLLEETEDDRDVLDELEDGLISQTGHDAVAAAALHTFDHRIALAFMILGAGMLWPFNSFITANEFFSKLFRHNPTLLRIYSPAITTNFTVTNLLATIYFTKTVRSTDLNTRISKSALSTTVLFGILAILTTAKLSPIVYFSLLMLIIAATAITTGGLQNGVFGLVGGFGPQYVQYIMIGQGIAGVTPAILSIVVALVDEDATKSASKRAFAYFLSSSMVLASSYFAHLHLRTRPDAPNVSAVSPSAAKEADLARWKKYLSTLHPWTILIVFAVTLAIFPSVTASVTSVLPTEEGVPFKDVPKYLQPSVFIPLGFLLWNGGDLLARVLSVFSVFAIENPKILFAAALSRILWIPAIYLCNIHGAGAIIKSDAFFFAYMILFGMSNGILGSLTFAAAVKQAPADQKRDVGSFMTFMLCLGLVVGSLLSFIF